MTLGDGWPPFYSERPSAAVVNPSQLYLGYAAIAVLIGLFLILPGVRGKERLFFLLRWCTSLFIGATIIACAQGVSWHVDSVETVMPFKANSEEMVRFKVGLMIGLSEFNVTLRGDGVQGGEDISFSERYYFLSADEALTDSLKRGLPFPILNVVEHFSVNRISTIWMWGRRYWIAGHYSFYMLWSAFGMWFVTNVLFHSVLLYGGMVLTFTGLLMLSANLSYFTISSHGRELQIHLGYDAPNAVLTPSYGWCYWLCFATGLLCVICGISVMIVHKWKPKALRLFFNYERDDSMLQDVDSDVHESPLTKYHEPKMSGKENPAFNMGGFSGTNNSHKLQSNGHNDRKASKVSFQFSEPPGIAEEDENDNLTSNSQAVNSLPTVKVIDPKINVADDAGYINTPL
nr:dual oxidase maturation factor 1-like [Ciona intestinalis]|eukprot:XP_018670932.1 dual oxidase maturation factor 1-like [Ciona intestinalis]